MQERIALIGASGAIGSALLKKLKKTGSEIHAFARSEPEKLEGITYHKMDYGEEASIEQAAKKGPFTKIFVTTGLLHAGEVQPEKSLSEVSAENLETLFAANTLFPALVAKHFLADISRTAPVTFAVLTARVGSIGDNRLGGWYSYRISKAALNMFLKTLSIEIKRKNKNALVVGLHPGTVDSPLSKPFQANVPEGKLFTPDFSAEKLLETLENLSPENSGSCFGWDGKEITP